jgi:hypothetical protein
MSPKRLNPNDVYNLVVKTVNSHNGWMDLSCKGELILFAYAFKNGNKSRLELIELVELKLHTLTKNKFINKINEFFEKIFTNKEALHDHGIYNLVVTTVNENGGWAFLSRQEQMELFAHAFKNGNKYPEKLIKSIESKQYRLTRDSIGYSIKRFFRKVFLRNIK